MKLLVITSIKEFKKDIKQMLQKANVKEYSYREVIGFRDISEDALESNWFASELNENESILFYAFVKKENVDLLFELTNKFNDGQKTLSKVHLVVLNIEKSN